MLFWYTVAVQKSHKVTLYTKHSQTIPLSASSGHCYMQNEVRVQNQFHRIIYYDLYIISGETERSATIDR